MNQERTFRGRPLVVDLELKLLECTLAHGRSGVCNIENEVDVNATMTKLQVCLLGK